MTTVVFEFATLAAVGVLVFVPRLGRTWSRGAVALASVVPVMVLVFSASALSSPGALDHGHVAGAGETGGPHLHTDGTGASAPTVTPVAAAPEAPLDAAGTEELDDELARVRAVLAQFPTVADAQAAGMYDATSPGGSTPRYFVAPFNQRFAADPGFDLEHPLVFLYLGRNPRSPVVGVAYYEFSEHGPKGFAGPSDTWRLLRGLCSLPTVGGGSRIVSIDSDMGRDQCTAVDGTYADSVQWSVHAWLAPRWENPEGEFSESNPRVPCVVDAYVRWLDTSRGTGRLPGPEATEVLTAELAACSPGSPTDR